MSSRTKRIEEWSRQTDAITDALRKQGTFCKCLPKHNEEIEKKKTNNNNWAHNLCRRTAGSTDGHVMCFEGNMAEAHAPV